MVLDVPAGASFLEVVGGYPGKAQAFIQFSDGQKPGVGGDGGTVKFQPDFGVELKSERGFSLSPIRCLQDTYAIVLKRLVPLRNYSPVPGKQIRYQSYR